MSAATETFFEEALPALLRHARPEDEPGAIYLAVDGAGEWTIHLGARSFVRPGRGDRLDAELYFHKEAFTRFLNGENVFGRGAFAVGQPRWLEKLARLLSPPARGIVDLRSTEQRRKS